MIFYSKPEDFKLNGKCTICKGHDLLVGQELLQRMEKILKDTQNFVFWLIKMHRKGIKKPIKCCTLSLRRLESSEDLEEASLLHKRHHRVLHTLCHLLCDAMVITFFGLFLGAVYFFLFLLGIVLLCLSYSPYATLGIALCRKVAHLWGTQIIQFPRGLPDIYAVNCFFYASTLLFMISYGVLVMLNLSVACFVAALSCRFIVKMFV